MVEKKSILIPWVVACALFMETLDTTIISTAIPTMARAFSIDPVSLKLAMTSYLISLAIFVPISGWIADKYGAKKVFIYAFIIFTVSSVLCAISSNLWELVSFRIMQGLGGDIMMPVGRLILLRIYPKEHLVKVTNYVTIPSLFGPMLGPLAGGFITTYASWHWIFLVNLPVGILGIFLAYKYIPQVNSTSINKFDYKGFILFGTGLASLSFLLSTVYESSINQHIRIILLMISIIALILYIINYKIFNSTLLNFNVFKIRTFRVTVIGSLFSRVGIGGIPFLLPLLFQLGFKYSPLISGLLVFPMAVAMFIMKFYVKPVLKLVGFKKSLMFNTLLLGISICSISILDKSSNWCLIIGLVFINGIFSSMQFSCMNVLTYVDLEPQILSQGTSIGSSIQQLSMSFGVAFGAICLKYFLSFYKLENFNTVAFSYSFIVIGTFTIFTAFIFTLLKSSDGITASGYKKG